MDSLSVTASIAGAISIVRSAINAVEKLQSAPSAVLELRNELQSYCSVLSSLKDALKSPPNGDVLDMQSLVEVIVTDLTMLDKISRLLKRHIELSLHESKMRSRTRWAVDKQALIQSRKQLNQMVSNTGLMLSMLHM